MSTQTPETAVGIAVSAFLYEWALEPGDLATAAQRLGLAWTASTVAELSAVTKPVTIAELILLPSVLADALGASAGPAPPSVSIGALLAPKDVTDLELAPATATDKPVTISVDALEQLLWGDPVRVRPTRRAVADVESETASTLGLTVGDVDKLAQEVWGRSLVEERDRRLADPKEAQRYWEGEIADRKQTAELALRTAASAGADDKTIAAVGDLMIMDDALRAGPPTDSGNHLRAGFDGVPTFRSALRRGVTQALVSELQTRLKSRSAIVPPTTGNPS